MLKLLLILSVFLEIFLSSGCSTITTEKKQLDIAHINITLGLFYLHHNQPKIAKRKLLLAYEQAPNDPEVHNALGYFFANTGEIVYAQKYYLSAIRLAKKKSRFWHSYGKFLCQQEHYQEGLNCFLLAARDLNYLDLAEAYADASKTAFKLNRKDLVKHYQNQAVIHGFKGVL